MKLITKLTTNDSMMRCGSLFGFGCVRAKDYEKERYGRLFLFAFITRWISVRKMVFIPRI